MMTDPTDQRNGAAVSLEIAARHLRELLAAVSGSDGQIMFLTALNVAGVSALIGVEVAADPSSWLLASGLTLSGLCIALGLSRLWASDVGQFPTPEEILRIAREHGHDSDALAWRHFYAVQLAIRDAEDHYRRRKLVMRALLLGTAMAFVTIAAAAITAGR